MLDTLATEVYAHTAMFNMRVQGLLQCVCVLGIGGKDSPRVWETCANLTAYGCLVVRSVCVINCSHTSDPPLSYWALILFQCFSATVHS